MNRNIPVLLALGGVLAIVLVVAGYSAATFTGMGLIPGGQGVVSLPAQITEAEAHSLVWSLPEVQSIADDLRAHGSRPLTLTLSRPQVSATPGTEEADYFIRLSEDRGDHIAAVETFAVDAYTKEVSVYDPVEGRRISIEEWRKSR